MLELFLIVSYHDSPVAIALDLLVVYLGTFISSWAYMELTFKKDANRFAWLGQLNGQ
jgi:hypothetical protein